MTAGPAARLAAMLDREAPDYAAGHPMPPLAHWLFFLPQERQSTLGPDGHARRGGFLPPVHELPRRMWAGARFAFHAPLRAGMAVERMLAPMFDGRALTLKGAPDPDAAPTAHMWAENDTGGCTMSAEVTFAQKAG